MKVWIPETEVSGKDTRGIAASDIYISDTGVSNRDTGMVLDSSMVEHTAVNRGVVGSSPTQGVAGKAGGFSCSSLYLHSGPRG